MLPVHRLAHWLPAVLLGFVTIGAYGTAYYSIGVLIPVISGDTGWSAGLLSAAYSLGVLIQGPIALVAGRTFDKHGSTPVMLPAIVLGGGLLALASLAQEGWHFVAAWAAGGALIGGGLYYNLTMPVLSRLYPGQRAAALSVLTLLGALASPIFYPIAGWMTDMWGWRGALQGLVALMAVCVLPAALLVHAPAAPRARTESALAGLRMAFGDPSVRRFLVVMVLVGMANSALVLQQVPVMQAAGLSIGAAAGFAGVRGAFQIPGRLFLTPITARLGVRGAIACCYALATTSALALLIALQGNAVNVLAFYFCAVGGMSLGMLSPLNGLFQAQVFGDERLGMLSGMTVIIGSLAGASSAFLSGALVDVTGGYETVLILVIVMQAIALPGLAWQKAAERPAPASVLEPAAGA